jgi:hypothetical protein
MLAPENAPPKTLAIKKARAKKMVKYIQTETLLSP